MFAGFFVIKVGYTSLGKVTILWKRNLIESAFQYDLIKCF